MNEIITKEQAYEIAEQNIEKFLTAEWGKRLVSDLEAPFQAYLQEQNTSSMAGEVFSVKCPGVNNMDCSYYREGWDNEGLTDVECIIDCCQCGDMTNEIQELADKIYEDANNN